MKTKHLCLQISYPDKNGEPDMKNGKVCTEWSSCSIKWKGVKERRYYCDKHKLIFTEFGYI